VATWDSADLLERLKRELQRPAVDEATTDAELYQYLSDGQEHWHGILAAHVPEANLSAPELMATADGGLTYSFLNVPFPSAPAGRVVLRDGRSGPVLVPGNDWDDWADYIIERDKIRIPSGRTRTFPNGLYAQYVRPIENPISASVQPQLQPSWARRLIVYRAAADFATAIKQNAEPFLRKEQHAAWGDPHNPGDVGILGQLKLMYFGRGRSASPQHDAVWFRAPGWV
jgi:hypothetical protein